MRNHVVGLVVLVGCATTQRGGGPPPGGLPSACSGDLGQGDAQVKLAVFLDAAGAFMAGAADIDRRLGVACRNLGRDLQMSAGEMETAGPDTASVCGQVAARMKSELDKARAEASVEAKLEIVEPVCTTKVDEYKRCIERCEPKVVRPGYVDYRCEGGELRGGCSAQCSGSCAVDVHGQCSGACEGTCSGSCGGTCNGFCEGECTQRLANGQCAGACRGTCRGTCSATCTGTCEGHCVVSGQASCRGECRGGCSVDFQAPVCTGHIVPPEVRTECRQSCDTVAVSREECTPGVAKLEVDASGAVNAAARVGGLAQAIAARIPEIHALSHRLQELKDSGEVMVKSADDAVQAAGQLGANASVCMAEVATSIPRAVASVGSSFSVSMNITVSFGAEVIVY